MKKKECPSCAMEIDYSEKVCPICGYEFPNESKTVKYFVAAIIIIFIVFLLILEL